LQTPKGLTLGIWVKCDQARRNLSIRRLRFTEAGLQERSKSDITRTQVYWRNKKTSKRGLGSPGGFIGSSFDSPTLEKPSFSWSSPSG